MAVTSWYKKVQEGGALTVTAGSAFKGGHWTSVLDGAISTFNKLMTENGLKLALSKAGDAKNAHIVVEAAGTKAGFSYAGTSYSATFDGNGLHGSTTPVADGRGFFEKAFVFVPATPRVSPTDKRSREAGPEVRRFILVHEFIHAAGLSNDEHTNDDVFCYPGQIDGGSRAADDRIEPWGGLGKPMPPYTLIAKTVTNLKKAWP